MILFVEAIRLSHEKEDNIWIDSEAEKMYLQFLLLFPMVVYTPRDEPEVAICRSLFWVSYNFSLRERRKNSAEWFCVTPDANSQESAAVA
jgi:hypothetical protein